MENNQVLTNNAVNTIKYFENISRWREWQLEANDIILDRLDSTYKDRKPCYMPIDASVGSGKTLVAFNAIYTHIKKVNSLIKKCHNNQTCNSSVNMFVAPTIDLIKQHLIDIKKFLVEMLQKDDPDFYKRISSTTHMDAATLNEYYNEYYDNILSAYNIIVKEINCRSNERYDKRFNIANSGKHYIFMLCDQSLWGSYKLSNGTMVNQFKNWKSCFKMWNNSNGKINYGVLVLDEAHHYSRQFKEYIQIGDLDYFKLLMFMSGTPAEYQCNIAREYPQNRVRCSLAKSINNHYVLKPMFFGVLCDVINNTSNFINVIKSVFRNEHNKNGRQLRLIVNCTGIDQIKDIISNDEFKRFAENINVIDIISDKDVYDENGELITFKACINGKAMHTNTIKQVLNYYDNIPVLQKDIDKETCIKSFKTNDGIIDIDFSKPVIVLQVHKISEGLNMKSFHTCIITSTKHDVVVQQSGRTIRKNPLDLYKEAHIYLVSENEKAVIDLFIDLFKIDDLTSECFDWVYNSVSDNGSSCKSEIPLWNQTHAYYEEFIEPRRIIIPTEKFETINNIQYVQLKNEMFKIVDNYKDDIITYFLESSQEEKDEFYKKIRAAIFHENSELYDSLDKIKEYFKYITNLIGKIIK